MFSKGLFLKVLKSQDCVVELTLNQVTKFNSLPNDKFLDWSNLKAFADDKMNVN